LPSCPRYEWRHPSRQFNPEACGREEDQPTRKRVRLRPQQPFASDAGVRAPRNVVGDPDLTLNEKRAILAAWASDAWASDACAVEAAPTLRQPPGAGRSGPVRRHHVRTARPRPPGDRQLSGAPTSSEHAGEPHARCIRAQIPPRRSQPLNQLISLSFAVAIATLKEDSVFEIISPPTDATEHLAHVNIESSKPRMMDGEPRKIVLPRRFGEPASDRSRIITRRPAPAYCQADVLPLRVEPASVLDSSL
jgi:hypothetical protein